MKTVIKTSLLLWLSLFSIVIFANNMPSHSVQVNYGTGSLISSLPHKTQQFGIQGSWLPPALDFRHFQIHLQGGYQYLTTHTRHNNRYSKHLNNFSLGPLLHIGLTPDNRLFFIAGAQPGYISKTRFGDRDQGIHFTFRDTLGLKLVLGEQKNIALSAAFIHYSHLFGKPNPGINVPLDFALAYQF